MKNKKGFTLIELLAVIAIMSVLAVIAVPNILNTYNESQKNIFLDEAKIIYKGATEQYALARTTTGTKITTVKSDNDENDPQTGTLDMTGRETSYNVRLDDDGHVTAIGVHNNKYCVYFPNERFFSKYGDVSITEKDFLESITKDDIVEYDENNEELKAKCNAGTVFMGERIKVNISDGFDSESVLEENNWSKHNSNPHYVYLEMTDKNVNPWTNSQGSPILSLTSLPRYSIHTLEGYYYNDVKVIDENGDFVYKYKGQNISQIFRNVSVDDTIALVGRWRLYQYYIKYISNNGQNKEDKTTHEFTNSSNIKKLMYTYPGHEFVNWSGSDGNNYNDQAAAPVIDAKNCSFTECKDEQTLELTANWNECPAGKYASDTMTVCNFCEVGTYQPNKAQSSCIKCASGTYQPNKGAASCNQCIAGYYQNSEGATSCNKCASGTYQPNKGAASCNQCIAGYYCPEGSANGIVCPINTYSAQGAGSCTACAKGYYTNNKTAQTACTLVPYTITVIYGNGQATETINYNITSNDITRTNPTRENYTFLGWKETITYDTLDGIKASDKSVASGSVLANLKVPKGSTGNRTYEAQWKQNSVFSFAYTGGYQVLKGSYYVTDGIVYIQEKPWVIRFTSGGTFTAKGPTAAEAYLVGAGNAGGSGWEDAYSRRTWGVGSSFGGAGGSGGGRTQSNVTINEGNSWTFTIGSGNTSAFGLTANKGAGSGGGAGAHSDSNGTNNGPGNGGTGPCAFNDCSIDNRHLGSGGGGGASYCAYWGTGAGSGGTNAGSGGGAGNCWVGGGGAGTANTGGGGGGGGGVQYYRDTCIGGAGGGAGGTGVVYLRSK